MDQVTAAWGGLRGEGGGGAGGGAGEGLTAALAALLHAVLVDVQREEHVRVAQVVLVTVLPVAPARVQGGVQEEGGLLGRGRPQLALVLQLEDTSES